jgi:small conductance mechanosensitive channel
MTRRRRETVAPFVRTAFTYAVYFSAAVLMLASLGFNPVPFLAGAGILGLVVGFGAQSLINDVVSGFFILFENTYLVGDSIEVADAKGIVEDIEFRTTKIRDSDGRMHVVRNGDVREVVNYSKGYTLAVVPVRVPYDTDLQAVWSVLREAGQRLRERSTDVTGETEIEGIVAFGRSDMTIRTTTRVKPGRHEAAKAELRFAINEAFDRQADESGRRGLVPSRFAARTVLVPRDGGLEHTTETARTDPPPFLHPARHSRISSRR